MSGKFLTSDWSQPSAEPFSGSLNPEISSEQWEKGEENSVRKDFEA